MNDATGPQGAASNAPGRSVARVPDALPPPLPAVLVSACLCGVECNHEGRAARRDVRVELAGRYRVIPVCPEMAGGLTTPRVAAEIVGGDGHDVVAGTARVLDRDGADVTAEYRRGAAQAVDVARAAGVERAVLKARSPSCGSSRIYDGTFTRTQRDGAGVTAAALQAAGVVVTSEDDDLP
jgi:uncharacterized protein YbbK (DUF523 family)